MIVTHDLTIVSLIANASIVVKFVMALLAVRLHAVAGPTSSSRCSPSAARAPQTDAFEREFWSGADLVGLYQRAVDGRYPPPAWSASSRRASASS